MLQNPFSIFSNQIYYFTKKSVSFSNKRLKICNSLLLHLYIAINLLLILHNVTYYILIINIIIFILRLDFNISFCYISYLRHITNN